MATKTVAASASRPCACRQFEVVTREFDNEGGEPDFDSYGTGCQEKTRREFAPGHDAKLKSMLIKAGALGYQIRIVDGGVATWTDAVGAANRFGFGYMVANGIKLRQAKAEKARKAVDAKLEAQAQPAPVPAEKPLPTVRATIKVGRWVYPGATIEGNIATYTTKTGEVKTADQFTVVL